MGTETRAAVADQARVYAFVSFLGAIAGWVGFAQQLHAELSDIPGYIDFDWKLILWLLLGALSSVLLVITGAVLWLHRYLEAPRSATAESAEPSGVQ